MTFYRSRAGNVGNSRVQPPSYRTAAAVDASVLVEQTGPDSVTISEIVDGQTVDQVVLPVITVPASAADASAAAPAERQVRSGLLGRVANAVVQRMSWTAEGDGSYTITPGEDEVISISGDSSMAVVVAVPIAPG